MNTGNHDLTLPSKTLASVIENTTTDFVPPQESAWNQPDMTLLQEGHCSPPSLPIELLDEHWQRWVRNTALSKGCPADYVFGDLIAAVAGLLGSARVASPWQGWTENSIVWVMLVGSPSSGKSPAMRAILDLLGKIEEKLNSAYENDLGSYAIAKERQEVALDHWKKQTLKKNPNAEKPQEAHEPEKPILQRIVIRDATIESVARILKENPKGLLLALDELAALVQNFERRGGCDKPFYLEAYNGGTYTVDRVKLLEQDKGHNKPVIVKSLSISILGGIQPDKLNSLILKGDNDGFAVRFLYIWPVSLAPKRPAHDPDCSLAAKALERLSDLKEQRTLPFEETASKRFQDWRQSSYQASQACSGLLADYRGKFGGFVVRLANILTFMDWAIGAERSEPQAIKKEYIEKAITLMETYFYPMAERCFFDASVSQQFRNTKLVARYIASKKLRGFNLREERRTTGSPFRSIKDEKDRKAALQLLTEYGWIRPANPQEEGNIGRTRSDFEVNPRVIDDNLISSHIPHT